ncbi:hypothetical protein QYE76_000042 [Lolium multiflorum]|uniref:Uncharacterized protein n=1 Tax=Lolium multiflorum TaxID=4521 RepID=A0AAD8QHH6_LOLMU|nr:hypothetical protein QYE76_000042 [Lolium multiflorum]
MPVVLFFHRSFQKTEKDTKWGHEVAIARARRSGPAPPLWCGPRAPDSLFRHLNTPVAKPDTRATIRKVPQTPPPLIPSRGFRDRFSPRLCRRGESSPEGSTSPCPLRIDVENSLLYSSSLLPLVMLENRAIETKEHDEMKKENDALKMENKLLKETIEELSAGKEEEDPQERLMFNSDGEVEPVAEEKKKKRKR